MQRLTPDAQAGVCVLGVTVAMKLLAMGRPKAGVDPRSAIAPHARAELYALWQLYALGSVREMYSPGGPGSVLVMEAQSIDAGRAALAELPLVANKIIDFELIQLEPFAAFGMLFAPEGTP